MVRRLFWFSLGAGAAVYFATKVRAVMAQATPTAITHRVSSSAVDLGTSVRGFSDRVRAAAAERESELREALGLIDSGND